MGRISADFFSLLVFLMKFPCLQGIAFGLGFWLFLTFSKNEKPFWQQFWGCVAVAGCGVPLGWGFITFGYNLSVQTPFYWWAFGVVIGLGGSIAVERFGLKDALMKKATKKSDHVRDSKTDIRDLMAKRKTELPSYDPEIYFKDDDWFIGLDEDDKPSYLGMSKLPHMQANGFSGAGKSVFLGVMSAQAILKGEATFVLDPKSDEWLPHVLKRNADRAGVKYHYVNFQSEIGQLNLLEGATAKQILEMLIEGLDLVLTGGDSDYYKAIGQRAAKFLANNYEAGETFADLFRKHEKYIRKTYDGSDGFLTALESLAEVESVNAHKSVVNLLEAMENKEVVLFVGSVFDLGIKRVQRMLYVRLAQLAMSRGNFTTPKPVCFIIDELPFFLSRLFVDLLTTIRDKGVHILFAYQSIESLKKVPSYMDGKVTMSEILDNAYLHFSYRTDNIETAEFYSKRTGNILVDDEIRHVEKTLALAESLSPNREVRQAERCFIDVNEMLSLSTGCGVLTGGGLAKKTFIAPIKAEKDLEAINIKGIKADKADKADKATAMMPNFDDL